MGISSKFRLVALAAILLLAMGSISACSAPPANPDAGVKPSVNNGLEIVYFHRTQRCWSCAYAEDATRYTIETYFADEVASGKLVFMSIDIKDEESAAIVDKYGAYTSSLFMNKVVNGVENIEQITAIWSVVGNDPAFVDKVKREIEERL